MTALDVDTQAVPQDRSHETTEHEQGIPTPPFEQAPAPSVSSGHSSTMSSLSRSSLASEPNAETNDDALADTELSELQSTSSRPVSISSSSARSDYPEADAASPVEDDDDEYP